MARLEAIHEAGRAIACQLWDQQCGSRVGWPLALLIRGLRSRGTPARVHESSRATPPVGGTQTNEPSLHFIFLRWSLDEAKTPPEWQFYRAGCCPSRAGCPLSRAGRSLSRAGRSPNRAGRFSSRAGWSSSRAGWSSSRAGTSLRHAGWSFSRAGRFHRHSGSTLRRAGCSLNCP